MPRIARLLPSVGAFLGVALTALVGRAVMGGAAPPPTLLAAMGASAVLLFAAPASPLARAWPALGGNVVSALVGVACARLFADPTLAAASAVALSIGAMSRLGCLHPPGGAVALFAVVGGPDVRAAGFGFVLAPVALNTVVMFGAARAWSALLRRVGA